MEPTVTFGSFDDIIWEKDEKKFTVAPGSTNCLDLMSLYGVLGGPDPGLRQAPTAMAYWNNPDQGFIAVIIMTVSDALRRRLTSARLPRQCLRKTLRSQERGEGRVKVRITADTGYPIAETARSIEGMASVDGGPPAERRSVVLGARGYLMVVSTVTASKEDSEECLRFIHAHAERVLT
jgi:hypothetical protein